MKSTLFLVILLIILAEGNITGYSEGQRSQYTQTGGSFLDRFSHRRITPVDGNSCFGFVEIRSEINGSETVHGKLIKDEGKDAMQLRKLRYTPRMPGGRNARKIIEVKGNCCWKFYSRYKRHFQSCNSLIFKVSISIFI